MSNTKVINGQSIATTYEFQFPQPREKVPITTFIFNPKDGTILGRTVTSWSKLLLFYAVFYTVLAGLFAICMKGLFSTLPENEPKWQLDSSLIGTNPGLGYRPSSEVQIERGSIIKFDKTKPEEAEEWKILLDEFLTPYNDHTILPNGGKNQIHCDFNTTINGPGPNKVCAIKTDSFGPCSTKNSYGYIESKPCVFLKLNKIFGWEPDYYDNVNELPEEMPKILKDKIKTLPPNELKQVWISCEGHNKLDNENIGPISYYPTPGFPFFYYPYKNVQDYLSPLVAVQFENPKMNILIGVECRAWAKNIIYSGSLRDRKGSVSFQINIDTETKLATNKTTE